MKPIFGSGKVMERRNKKVSNEREVRIFQQRQSGAKTQLSRGDSEIETTGKRGKPPAYVQRGGKVKRAVKQMLARYYVYEQHMRRGRNSARKPGGRGYRGARASRENERKLENYERRKADRIITVDTGGSGQHEKHGMKSQDKRRSIHEM
jgi:hypothetical protein